MTYEQLTDSIYGWLHDHKRIICYIAGVVGVLCFLMEACDVIH